MALEIKKTMRGGKDRHAHTVRERASMQSRMRERENKEKFIMYSSISI